MDVDEQEQYRAAIHGDRKAFEMIIRTYSRTLFAIAYGILQNREEAEDAVQDSFVKAWKSRWRVRNPEKFPAWLCTITRHRAHDLLRKHAQTRMEADVASAASRWSASPAGTVGQRPTPASAAIFSDSDETERHSQIQSALASLPELHRTALMLRYFEEMDYRTIENTLGLTNGALRGILGRALASLRKQLRPALASSD
jgi:RNA polymerase sigma-70 factor (ECF subfamily)